MASCSHFLNIIRSTQYSKAKAATCCHSYPVRAQVPSIVWYNYSVQYISLYWQELDQDRIAHAATACIRQARHLANMTIITSALDAARCKSFRTRTGVHIPP